MAGFMDILGTLVQQGMSQSSSGRMGNALGMGRGGESLDDIMGGLTRMLGKGQTGVKPQATAEAGAGGILGEVLGSLGGGKSPALGGLGALAGALFGGGKASSRGAIGSGGLAMLASLAFAALKKAGQRPAQVPRALLEPQTPQEEEALQQDAEIIVKAMINAAKADGRIDEEEIQKIVGKLEQDGLTQEEKEFFIREAHKPLDLDAVIASAGGQPEMAAQIYSASLLAIEVDTREERQYLQQLAAGLNMDPRVTDNIEQLLGV